MAIVLSMIQEAGGCGKTTTTMNVAYAFASKGKKILLIDLDGQGGNITFFSGVRVSKDTVTMFDVIQRNADIHDAIIHVTDQIDLIPATVDVISISGRQETLGRMKEALTSVQNEYDYIFFDNNPDPTWRHTLSLWASQYVVIVMTGDMKSLEACKSILTSVEEVRLINPSLKIVGFVFNNFNQRTIIAQTVYDTAKVMAEHAHTKIFQTIIRKDISFMEAMANHMSILEYAPRSRGAEDIRAFANELEGEIHEC